MRKIKHDEKQVSLPFFGIPRLFPYLKQYRVKIICMILLGAISSAMDACYPLFNRYALNHFIGEMTLNQLCQLCGMREGRNVSGQGSSE